MFSSLETLQTASRLLTYLIHVDNSERSFGMQALQFPFVGITPSPLFVVARAAASTFLARKGTPTSST